MRGTASTPEAEAERRRKVAEKAHARRDETAQKMREQWEVWRAENGKTLGYYGKHRRVRTARGPAKNYDCVQCGASAKHWAQTHGTSGESPDDYRPMCQHCHWMYDDVGARVNASSTKPKRSTSARAMWDRRTPEERAAILAKGAATKARKRADAALAESLGRTGQPKR